MTEEVYGSTTAPNPKSSWIRGPSEPLEKVRCGVKGCQVLLSFVAFVLEEAVHSCVRCSELYFFEFVSCSSFLFTLLLLVLLYSFLRDRVGVTCWPKVDFVYSSVVFVLFLTSSIVFASSHSNTALEKSAAAFGFLASLAFFVDVVLFWKSSGFPFLKDGKPTPSNGGVVADGSPETAKLNEPE